MRRLLGSFDWIGMSSVSSAAINTSCEACGQEIPAGANRCPACGQAVASGSARLTLFIVFVLIVAGFAFTQYFVKLHRRTEQSLAQRWFTRGEEAMRAADPAAASDDYRTALSYDRENRVYRLRLSEALLASNNLNEARAHLLSLWDEEPADGEVNLALARLYALRHAPTQAERYYRNAINGVWSKDPHQERIATRFELVHYLMQRHDTGQASAELLALEADEPADVSDQLRLADLLLQVGEATRAVDVYDKVLKDDPGNVQAWLGVGKASFALAQYQQAEHALTMAVDRDPTSAEARQQLDLVREVLRVAPSLRGLSLAERTRRVAEAFDVATKRLTGCATQKGYSLSAQGVATPSASSENKNLPA
ncbi:MAG: tetratricopeptide repeat protein, partial [Candidatus Korobacteraceae bacterium]